MSSIKTESLEQAYYVYLNDVVEHPYYDRLRVDFIFKDTDDELKMSCTLLDFNDTIRVFDGLELARMKYRREIKAIKGNNLNIVKDD